MRYAIYGVNRVAKDFMYIFSELEVMCFFEESGGTVFLGRQVYPIKDLDISSKEWDKIIICDFDKTSKKNVLEQMGLQYGENFIYEEDLFQELDEVQLNPHKKRIAVWGTGRRSEEFLKWNRCYSIDFYIDTYKKQENFYDVPVRMPSEIQNWKEIFVIIAVAKNEEIEEKLKAEGLEEYTDFCSSRKIMWIPSELLRETIFDKSYYNFKCETMLNHVELGLGGGINCCCTTFVDIAIGNIREQRFSEVWQGAIHKILCLSAQNRTYSFCKKDICPLFIGKEASTSEVIDERYYPMREAPNTVLLGFDDTCNLKCATCRRELYIAKGTEADKMQGYAQIAEDVLLQNCDFLILAGNGEVFASPAYRKICMSGQMERIKQVRLLSNGTLFNPQNWNSMKRGKSTKVMLTVSIDAATKETYAKIRCRGNFEQLQKNMLFASGLRKSGELSYLRFNFVVQKENYQEMIPFVKWGIELGVDEIFFTKILNWGTYTAEEFKDVSMMEEDGVTPKKELERVLNDSVMDNPIVDMGTIRHSNRRIVDISSVENYYMWELERKVPNLFV